MAAGMRLGNLLMPAVLGPGPVLVLMSDPEQPRTAVVVPCFNDGRLAVEAVATLANQEPVELVVVDDASTDHATVAALSELAAQGVRVIRHRENRGLSAARMTGVEATHARFVFPLDSDDLLVSGALTALADRLDADSGLAAAYADYEEFGTISRVVRVPMRLDPFRIAFRNEYPVAALFRRTALEQTGGWRDVAGLVGYEDWHLWMTLAEGGHRAERVEGLVALRRRLHGSRMLGDAGRRHRQLYSHLRRLHPTLFTQLARHRRASDLALSRKLAYPLLFGARPPLGLWSRVLALRSAGVRRAQDS